MNNHLNNKSLKSIVMRYLIEVNIILISVVTGYVLIEEGFSKIGSFVCPVLIGCILFYAKVKITRLVNDRQEKLSESRYRLILESYKDVIGEEKYKKEINILDSKKKE